MRWWMAIGILVASVLASSELILRQAGYQSGPHDDDAFWVYHRLSVESLRHDAVVCIGSSRCQAGVRIEQLSDAIDRPVVQLSIAGSSPLPVLEDLAKRSTFRGTIVMAISPHNAFSDSVERNGNAIDWIQRYHDIRSSPGERAELWLKIAARNSVLLRQDFNWRTVLNRYVLRGEPAYKEVFTKATRWKHFPDVMKGSRCGFPIEIAPSDRDFRTRVPLIHRYASAIRLIEQRGGGVIIIRPPSTGFDSDKLGLIDNEKMFRPRTDFYDELVTRCGVPAFHAEDIDELKNLYGVDGSHLCDSDAKTYTNWLAKTLRKLPRND